MAEEGEEVLEEEVLEEEVLEKRSSRNLSKSSEAALVLETPPVLELVRSNQRKIRAQTGSSPLHPWKFWFRFRF